MNNLLSYFGLVDERISASEKHLPVRNAHSIHLMSFGATQYSAKIDQNRVEVSESLKAF